MQQLTEHIDQLGTHEHERIYTIVSRWTKDYTRTDTGVFVSTAKLPKECITELEQYVNFCFDQRKHLAETDAERERYEKLAKTGHGSS